MKFFSEFERTLAEKLSSFEGQNQRISMVSILTIPNPIPRNRSEVKNLRNMTYDFRRFLQS